MEALRAATAGDFECVTIDGRTWRRQSPPIERLDEASSLMRGVFGNLVWEARRLNDYMSQLSACATCTYVFDLRDERHAVVDGNHFCPACNIEATRSEP